MKPYVLLDMNNLCHISYHSMGNLSNDDKEVGVIFGVLKQLLSLSKKIESNRFVFLWDSRKNFRKEIYPEYKANRIKSNDEHHEDRMCLYNQITELRRDVIPGLGFNNSFLQSGYEADDLIVHFIIHHPKDEFVIVSTDQDLYQVLRPTVKISNIIKKSFYTEHDFRENYVNLHPINYRLIKCYTGCKSDNIPGIDGVGEKTAVKYLKSEINHSKAFQEIQKNKMLVDFNEKLVYLPYIHGPIPINIMRTKKNELSRSKFQHIFNMYSFNSFIKDFSSWEKHFGLK